jgi:hypothetical protein
VAPVIAEGELVMARRRTCQISGTLHGAAFAGMDRRAVSALEA